MRRNVQLMCLRRQNTIKGKCYVFSGYKQQNKAGLVYLESKLKQDSYGLCISKLKCQKAVEEIYSDTRKQIRT